MPRSMGDSNYEYRPLDAEARAKLSRAQRRRLGIPDGHARVYGENVPEAVAPAVRKVAQEAARRAGPASAKATVDAVRRRGWKVPRAESSTTKSAGVSTAYGCLSTALPEVFRG